MVRKAKAAGQPVKSLTPISVDCLRQFDLSWKTPIHGGGGKVDKIFESS